MCRAELGCRREPPCVTVENVSCATSSDGAGISGKWRQVESEALTCTYLHTPPFGQGGLSGLHHCGEQDAGV